MGGKPSLPGAACSALGGSGGAPRVVLLGRGSSFPLPPRKARDTHDCLINEVVRRLRMLWSIECQLQLARLWPLFARGETRRDANAQSVSARGARAEGGWSVEDVGRREN